VIQHLELNCEWVGRRMYKECFFGGSVSAETKIEARERLAIGLDAVARLSSFSPYILGSSFTAADCAAYVHFLMITLATRKIYGRDMLEHHIPKAAAFMRLMEARPHVQAIASGREAALAAFIALNVKYDG
jgi:glutathione S-transferase